MVEHALTLAGLGLRVFPLHHMTGDELIEWECSCGRPCLSPAKHPRTANGCKDATLDSAIISEWWARWPDANIGLATGEGVYVVDLDGPEGLASWRALGIPDPPMRATTGSGGLHLFYGLPLDDPMPNTAGKLGAGIDTRGRGGYVVAAPSNHKSGSRYRWETTDRTLEPLPEALRVLLRPSTSTPLAPPRLTDATSPYGAGVLTHAIERIHAAPEGTRNQTLNDEAFLVGQFIGGGEIDPAGVEHMLADACQGPDKKKNTTTVRRALHDGMQHGRNAPEGDKP